MVSVSPSQRGAQWAREDLARILRVAGAALLDESVGVATVHDTLDDGHLADADVTDSLQGLGDTLVAAELEHRAA